MPRTEPEHDDGVLHKPGSGAGLGSSPPARGLSTPFGETQRKEANVPKSGAGEGRAAPSTPDGPGACHAGPREKGLVESTKARAPSPPLPASSSQGGQRWLRVRAVELGLVFMSDPDSGGFMTIY